MNPREVVILVIEDNPITRKVVRMILRAEGFAVIEARDGAEALSLAATRPPDLILQDLLLPDVDGFELVGQLRAQPELAGVPIIAFSGFLSRLEYGRAAALGFADFIPKPVEPSHLIEVVRAHLPPELAMVDELGHGRRVLLADDDPVQLKLTQIRLSRLGWAVTTARDGVDALEVLERGGTEAVVSDVLMPRLDGFGLCAAIRSDARSSHVPVVLVSSNYLEEADRELARSMGARALVVRTPDLAEVIEALEAAMSAHSEAPPAFILPDPAAYHQRVVRQLERQASMNAVLAHRSSMHASMLSVVADISEALTRRHFVEGALSDILASLLDACGVSRGALFIQGEAAIGASQSALQNLTLRAHAGFSAAVAETLGAFFGHRELFERAVVARAPIVVSAGREGSAGQEFLARASVKSALLVPLVSDQECLGIFLLASRTRDLAEEDWLPFARTMAAQIGQALSLSRAFSNLAASESRYRLLVQGASDGIFAIDRQGNFEELNPAMERFLGRGRSEVLGTSLSAFIAPADHEHAAHDFAELLERGQVRLDARRFTRPDGSVVLGDVSASAVDVEGGLLLGILRDVTEKNQMEADARLLESVTLAAAEAPDLRSAFEAVLRKLCETNGWMVGAAWVPRPKGDVLECACFWTRDAADRARCQLLGESDLALGAGGPGRAWSSRKPIWIRELATEPGCPRSGVAAALGVHAGVAVPVIEDARVIAVVEFFMDHARGEEVRFVRLVTAACERLASIMARKSAADALRLSEARFARLAESGIIGIVIGDSTGKILEANDAFLRMGGYSRDELHGGAIQWTVLTPPEYEAQVRSNLAQLAEHGAVPAFEMESFRKDGSRVPILIGAALLDAPYMIAFVADLTERKRAETALLKSESLLRQAQKMEAVGRLAGGVAHDFNNLLSVILSYGELLVSDLAPGDPMRADLERINDAGRRAAELTRQLLMFSRQQIIDPRVLDLGALISGMHPMLRRILGEDVELVSVPSRSPGRVLADPGSIEQIIMNLVVNARDAMPTGGQLTIETLNVELDADDAAAHPGTTPGRHVMLAVSDTGIGMDRETQARVFEPFFTTKSKDKGTGLGLSTVFGIVQQCGGSVSIYSEPRKGTSFKVYLPRVDAEPDAARVRDRRVNARGTETILLVEDEEQVRVVATTILRKLGYRILEARNAGEALLLCEAEAGVIHLLLTDVVMPQMSGPELAKRLAGIRPQMKVLCMSGYTDDSIVRHGVLGAEIAYLQKPITPQNFAQKVREVLDAPARALPRL